MESQILKALGDVIESKRKHEEAVQELDKYLSGIFPDTNAQKTAESNTPVCSNYASLMAVDEALRFDYVVPYFAGRFSTSMLKSDRIQSGVGCFPPLENLE